MTIASILPVIASAVVAAPEPLPELLQTQAWSGEIVHPLRYARVEFSDGPVIRLADPWIEPSAGPRGGNCSRGVAFDCIDVHWPGDLQNRCGMPATVRYFFGPAYNNPNTFDDLVIEPAARGSSAFEAILCLYKGLSEPTYIVVAIFEDCDPQHCGIDTDGDGDPDVPGANITSAFIFDYGIPPVGSSLFVIDLCDDPTGFILPADGAGGQSLTVFHSGTDTDGDGLP